MSNEIKPTKWKLKKGTGLDIPGVPFTITNANVNDENVIKTITRMEGSTGKKHFGTTIIKA